MSLLDSLGPAIVRNWVRLYTGGLPAPVRAERRDELESDIWEHRRDPSWPFAAGLEMVVRMTLGIPADLTWRLEQASMGERAGAILRRVLGRIENVSNWIVQHGLPGLTALLVWVFVGGGVLLVALAPFQPPGERGIAILGAWAIMAGLAIRWGRSRVPVRPRAGFTAILLGAVPLGLVLVVTVVAPLATLLVVISEGRRSWSAWQIRRTGLV